jgi:hypothetical protein
LLNAVLAQYFGAMGMNLILDVLCRLTMIVHFEQQMQGWSYPLAKWPMAKMIQSGY